MPRRFSASTPGLIAAAMMKPRKTSERTSFSFHSARAPTTTATPTSVATNAFRAVPAIPGALVLACAAFVAVRAAWEWESTRLVVTTEKLYVTYGFWRRRAAGVHLARTKTLEVEQTLLGRLLGYGTLIAGELEVDYVARPWHVWQAAGGVEQPRRRPLAKDQAPRPERRA